MHSEIHRFANGKLIDQLAMDSDEFDLDDEINKLMDELNDVEDPIIQEFAQTRCKFLGWSVERVYDPADYYANELGYIYCITGVNYVA